MTIKVFSESRRGWPKPWEHRAIAGKHVVTVHREYEGTETFLRAVCQCRWTSRVELDRGDDLDFAILEHWQSEIDRDRATRRGAAA